MKNVRSPNDDFEGLSSSMDPIMRVGGPDLAPAAATGQPRRQAVVRYS